MQFTRDVLLPSVWFEELNEGRRLFGKYEEVDAPAIEDMFDLKMEHNGRTDLLLGDM